VKKIAECSPERAMIWSKAEEQDRRRRQVAKNSPERVMMKKTSMKMRAPVSTSAKLKSKMSLMM
jgi:hypothetical protein